jgi:pantetheine-phosphate adenylyltransferase
MAHLASPKSTVMVIAVSPCIERGKKVTIAVYPGTFDPITNGHLDIAIRASRLFDKVIIGVYNIPDKHLMFSTSERVELVKKAVADYPNIEVTSFGGLIVEFAKKIGALTIVRGLRFGADFEHEFEMAMMNKKLWPGFELICLMANPQYQFLSSSLLKEVASMGADIENLVPPHVAEALTKKLRD